MNLTNSLSEALAKVNADVPKIVHTRCARVVYGLCTQKIVQNRKG
jgi:hypothetical protein